MNHIFARIGSHMTGGQFASILKELDIRYIRNRWGRATARGQGSSTKFSKASPTGDTNVNGDMHDYPFVITYLSSTYGAVGGPVIGDDMVTLNRSANPQQPDWVILGKLSSTKFDADMGTPLSVGMTYVHGFGDLPTNNADVVLQTTDFDHGGFWAAAQSTYVKVPAGGGGIYVVTINVRMHFTRAVGTDATYDPPGGGAYTARVMVNGGDANGFLRLTESMNGFSQHNWIAEMSGASVLNLAAGDQVSINLSWDAVSLTQGVTNQGRLSLARLF